MNDLLRDIFDRMLAATWQASVIAVIVLAVQWIAQERLLPRWRGTLWGLVLLRLALPALPPSPLSLMNLRSRPPATTATVGTEMITYGVIPSQKPAIAPQPLKFANTPVDRPAVVATVWFAVASSFILLRMLGSFRFSRRLRRLPQNTDPRLIDALNHHTANPPPCIETDLVRTPALTGVFAPRLLIPIGLADRLTGTELRFVIAHELAHLRRRDVLVGWIAWLIAAVHWFNPIAWLAVARFHAERELACDAAVLSQTRDHDRLTYGQTILRILELFPGPSPRATVAVGMLSSRGSIRRRIASISATPRSRWPLVGPLLLIAIGCATLTGPKRPAVATHSTRDTDPSAVVDRAYDIRDIIIDVPSFTNAPSLGIKTLATTRSAKRDGPPAKTRAELVDDVVRFIQEEVDPQSWRSHGGAVGEIKEMNGHLLITQTTANHEAIQLLMQDLRGAHGVQVTLEARFLTGEPVFRALEQHANGKRWQAAKGHQFWPAYLNDNETTALLYAAQSSTQSTLVTAPRITLFNGQRAYVLVSRQTAFVSDLKPSTTQPGNYDAEIGIAESGILLDADANVSADRKVVTITLRPQLSTILDIEPKPWPGAPAGRDDLIVQVPRMRTTKVEATTAIPHNQTALLRLRPRTYPPSTTQPADADEPVLVMIRPRIIVTEPGNEPQSLLSSRTTTKPVVKSDK